MEQQKKSLFTGRMSRKEFVVGTALLLGGGLVAFGLADFIGSFSVFVAMLFVYVPFALILFIAMGVRRLHDFELSGWWLLTNLILPYLILLLLIVLPGFKEDNRFGTCVRNRKLDFRCVLFNRCD